MASRADQAEAAAALRRLLEQIDAGAIDADTPSERRATARLQGAVATLEAGSRPLRPPRR